MHRHVWKVVEKVEHPSLLEQLVVADVRDAKGLPRAVDISRRAVIVTYRCECGSEKVKRV